MPPPGRLLPARHGHRLQGRRVDGARRAGHLASFDRSKCKAPLNGPNAATGNSAWKAGRSTVPRAAIQGRGRSGQRRARLLTSGSTASTRWASGPDVPIAIDQSAARRLRRWCDGKFVDAARALSDGLLHEERRRPHRRPQCRLEGPRPVDDVRARAPSSTRKAARAAGQGRSTSRSGRIRWRIERRTMLTERPRNAGPHRRALGVCQLSRSET